MPTHPRRLAPGGFRLAALLLGAVACDNAAPVTDNPAALALVSAPTATVLVGTPLAPQPVVELRTAAGEPLRTDGIPVVASASRGTLSGTTTVLTDDEGRATFADLVLDGEEGPAELRFTCCNLSPATHPVSLSFGGNLIAPASQASVSARAGAVMAPGPAINVTDRHRAPVGGAIVRFTVEGPGSIPVTELVSDASGYVELPSYTFGETPGVAVLTARLDGTQHKLRFLMESKLVGEAAAQDEGFLYVAEAGSDFTVPDIRVTQDGSPVAGVEVRFQIVSPVPTPDLTVVTDASGLAGGISFPLRSSRGLTVIEAFAPGYMPAPIRMRVIGDHLPLRLVTDAPANVLTLEDIGARVTYLLVRVENRLGEPVPSVPLLLSPEGQVGDFSFYGDFGLAGPRVETDDLGLGALFWEVPMETGTYRLNVSAAEYVATPMTLTAIR